MEIFVISIVAFSVSILTFFSGFGLGTILLPIFALWFPIDLSVAMTAIVHFLNNLFKLFLVGKNANKIVVLRFGLPAIFGAFLGAYLLLKVIHFEPILKYELIGRTLSVTPIKLIISILMIVFTLFEVLPNLKNLKLDSKYLSVGGLLSGFFGGLSGHQGALRSIFLVKAGLTKDSFIATGVVIACLVDLVRMGMYFEHFKQEGFSKNLHIIFFATLSAFVGAYIGNKILKKITMITIQKIVSTGLIILAVALGLGLI